MSEQQGSSSDIFLCTVCNESYTTMKDLGEHYKVRHFDDRPYKCTHCGKGFRSLGHLKEHRFVHNETNEFHCPLCMKGFKHPKSVRVHEHSCPGFVAETKPTRKQPSRKKEPTVQETSVEKPPISEEPTDQETAMQKPPISEEPTDQETAIQNPPRDEEPIDIQKFMPKRPRGRPPKRKRVSVPEAPATSASKHTISTEMPCQQSLSVDSHKCDICDTTFPNVLKLQNHIKWHVRRHRYKCNICDRVFKHISILKRHQEQHARETRVKLKVKPRKKKPRNRVDCMICGKTLSCATSLKRHITEVHEQVKRSMCSVCQKRFGSVYSLRLHVQRCHKAKKHQCHICKKLFALQTDLNSHYKRSHHIDDFKSVVASLPPQSHPMEHTSVQNEARPPAKVVSADEKTTPPGRQYSCYVCGQRFVQSCHLTDHCRSVHNIEKAHKCETCGIAFEKRRPYNQHVTKCQASLKRSQASPKRSQASKGQKRKYEAVTCDICEAVLCSPASLKSHLDIHLDRRPYSCRFCDMRFRQSVHLYKHCKSMHNCDFPYKCDDCGKLFKRRMVFKMHQHSHGRLESNSDLDSEKPTADVHGSINFEPTYTKIVRSAPTEYACALCEFSSQTYKSMSALQRHITFIHTRPAKKPENVEQPASSPNKPSERKQDVPSTTAFAPKEKPKKAPFRQEVYKCEKCSVIVHGWEALEAHEKGHTKNRRGSSTRKWNSNASSPSMGSLLQPTVEKFVCRFCGREFDAREAFDEHELNHELLASEPMGMAYMCVECDVEFAMASDMVRHYSQAHSGR